MIIMKWKLLEVQCLIEMLYRHFIKRFTKQKLDYCVIRTRGQGVEQVKRRQGMGGQMDAEGVPALRWGCGV